MSRLASSFKPPVGKALIGYITVGYPDIETTLEVVPLLAKCGCDIVELGIPFSDPLADGVTIQKSSFRALQNGVTPKICLEITRQLRQKVDIPLVFMSYFNPVLSYGLTEFVTDCVRSGIDGLIIPDLPPEEGVELEVITRQRGLDLIYLLAPTSTESRIRLVTEKSRGFLYLVSVAGVTGTRSRLPADLAGFVARVRTVAKQPLCIGFGISTAAQAKQAARIADGVIVGSRFIQLMKTGNLDAVAVFAKSLRRALDEVPRLTLKK